MIKTPFGEVVAAIDDERLRQDKQWGEQNHAFEKWQSIFIEELGEANKARLQGNHNQYVRELVEGAAVMVAWLESEIRKHGALYTPEEPDMFTRILEGESSK